MTNALGPMASYEQIYGEDRFDDALNERAGSRASPAGDARQEGDEQLRYEVLRARLLTPAQLEELPSPDELIEGYFTLNSLVTVFGRPATAKSVLVMSQAFSIVNGLPWFGHEVRQGAVLYIAAEGAGGLGQRQRAWRQSAGWPALDGMHWLPMPVNLLDPSWTAALVRLVSELTPVFVVFDTLSRSMAGGDENASADMSRLVAAADRVRAASGATTALVHHSPKEGSTPRGHSVLEGAVDTAIFLERNGPSVTLTVTKQKDLPTLEPFVFTLQPVGSSVVPVLTNGTDNGPGLLTVEKDVLEALCQSDDSTGLATTTWLRVSGAPERAFYRAKKVLVAKGLVRNVGTERQMRWVATSLVLTPTDNYCQEPLSVLHDNPPLLRRVSGVSTSPSDSAEDEFDDDTCADELDFTEKPPTDEQLDERADEDAAQREAEK
jgi:hypothetical protein